MNFKNILLFTLIILLVNFTACSSDNTLDVNTPDDLPEPEEVNNMDAFIPLEEVTDCEKRNLQGRGYDLTATFVSYKSVRGKVLDIEKYTKDHAGRIYLSNASYGHNTTAYGGTVKHYTKSLTYTIRGNKEASMFENNAAFSGTILDNDIFEQEDRSLDDCSFSSVHYYYISTQYNLNDIDERLILYVTDEFLNDLVILSDVDVIEKYGTHVLTDYSTGGRLDLIYSSKVKGLYSNVGKEENTYYVEKVVTEGLRYAVNKIGYWFNGSIEPLVDENVEKNKVPVLFLENHGGDDNLIPSGIYNLQKEYPVFDMDKWLQSITKENESIVDFNMKTLIPIYDLVSNQEKKESLRSSVEKYIEKRQSK